MNDSNTDLTQHFNQKDTQPSNNQLPNNHVAVSVITTCYGRNRHLYNLLSSLEQGSVQPKEVIIVNDDADPKRLAEFSLNIIQIPTTVSDSTTGLNTASTKASTSCAKPKFDIGHNRNLGAAKAHHEALIFLDVDCIVAPHFIKQMSLKLQEQPDALIMGQPRYLTRPLTVDESTLLKEGKLPVEALNTLSVYNPYRYNFEPSDSGFSSYENISNKDNLDGNLDTHLDTYLDNNTDNNLKSIQNNKVEIDSAKTAPSNAANTLLKEATQAKPSLPVSTPMMKTDDYGAFWSLCFALTRQQFQNIGGFDTQYIGYGAEDTDFAFTARAINIDFYLSADVVYHQQHEVYRPPLNHLDSIVINANRFYDKWQHWPMGGWLHQFVDMELIEWTEQQRKPITVVREPLEDELQSAHCPDAPFV